MNGKSTKSVMDCYGVLHETEAEYVIVETKENTNNVLCHAEIFDRGELGMEVMEMLGFSVIINVQHHSWASHAGIRVGGILIAVNGETLWNYDSALVLDKIVNSPLPTLIEILHLPVSETQRLGEISDIVLEQVPRQRMRLAFVVKYMIMSMLATTFKNSEFPFVGNSSLDQLHGGYFRKALLPFLLVPTKVPSDAEVLTFGNVLDEFLAQTSTDEMKQLLNQIPGLCDLVTCLCQTSVAGVHEKVRSRFNGQIPTLVGCEHTEKCNSQRMLRFALCLFAGFYHGSIVVRVSTCFCEYDVNG